MPVHVNLTAYEGVESMSRFTDEGFKKYCSDKLASCDKHVAFIKDHFPGKKLHVLEVGSGSGKLLFKLEQEGLLESGAGFETSTSRTIFAEEFKKHTGSKVVSIHNADYLASDLGNNKFDLIIGIDVVINLIGAISPMHTDIFIRRSIDYLVPGGCILLESITLEREMGFVKNSEHGVFNTWKKFADTDPFKYGLDEMSIDEEDNLVWKKYFINRNSTKEESFTNILKPMNKDYFSSLAEKCKMQAVFFDTWDLNDDTSDQEFLVLLKK